MLAQSIQLDIEFQDDGFFSVTFYFKPEDTPYYISVARDEYEDPDNIYLEAHDQIHGFNTTALKYFTVGSTITLDISDDHYNSFFWNNSKTIDIEIPARQKEVQVCLDRILELGRRSAF